MQLVYDIEANGLLDKVTKIWCIFGIDIVTNEQYLFHDFEGFCNATGVDNLGKEFTIPAKKGSLEDGVTFLSNAKNLICHNQLGYDQFLIKKFYSDFKIRYNYPEIRDTLLESQVQWFDRKPVKGYKGIHGLAVWGARLGIRKPEIEDWSTFDIQKLNRCIEDVKINVLVAKALEQERYKLLSECGLEFDQALKYEHEYRYFCSKQELNGALVDKPHMEKCLVELDQYIDELTQTIEPKLPPTIIVKGGKVTKQDLFDSLGIKKKVPTKYVEKEVKGETKLYPVKDWYKPVTKYLTEKVAKKYQVQLKGSDKPLEMVFDKLKEARDFAKSVYPNEKVTYPSYEETVTAFTKHTEDHFGDTLKQIKIVGPHTKIDAEPSTMSQDDKVKMYLLSLGWKTDEWTIAKDDEGNFKVADRSGVVRWPEVPYMGLQLEKEYKPGDKVPATPKVSKESLATLEDGLGDDIKKYNTYVHRRNFICNKRDDTKGLLNNIRADARVTCGLTSFGTTAGRATHYNFVNAPSSSVLYGKEIRKIIVAAPNHTLIGVDMPSAHPRLLADFTNNEHFAKAVDGFEDDPVTEKYVGEDFHTVNSLTFDLACKEDVQKAVQTQDKELIEKLKKARKKGKGGTYAVMYGGSGAKVGFVLGKSPEEGNRLKEKFLSVLGLDSVLEDVLQYWESRKWNRGSFVQVLGGYWVWCSSKHKIINYKALGSEAVMQKIAIILLNRKFEALDLKTKQILNMHDEALFEVPDNEIDIAKPLIENMYKEAATYLNLKLDWTSVAKTGSNYYECH